MALSIRLSRGGSKKRPYYRIVVADARSPRDGRFIEKIGTYNPLLAKDDEKRVTLDGDRAKHWLGVGAQPSDRVARFLDAQGIRERAARNNPQKGEPGEKAKERAEEQATKAAAAEEAKAAAAAAPAPEPEVEAPVADGTKDAETAAVDAIETATEEPTAEGEADAAAELTAEAPVEAAPVEQAPVDEATDANAATPNSDAGDEPAAADGESAQVPAEGAAEEAAKA